MDLIVSAAEFSYSSLIFLFLILFFFLTSLSFPLMHSIILHMTYKTCQEEGFLPQITFKGHQRHIFVKSRILLLCKNSCHQLVNFCSSFWLTVS